MDLTKIWGGGFTFSPQNGLNHEQKVFASISSNMSARVSPLNPISKRSWFWGSVELWSEGGAVGNGIVVIHGKTARFAVRRAVHKSIDRPLAVVPCKPRARLPSQSQSVRGQSHVVNRSAGSFGASFRGN